MSEAPLVLVTERMVGSALADSDGPDFEAFYADPFVMKTLSADGKPWPRSASKELMKLHIAHWREHGYGSWIFRDAVDRRFLGRSGLRAVDVGRGPEVELFYGVASNSWGRGLGTEMARAVLEVAFGQVGLDTVVGFVLPSNARSRRVLDKCGFIPAGQIVHAGLTHDLLLLHRRAPQAGSTP